MLRLLAFSIARCLASPAWADRRDLYTQVAVGPTLLTLEDRHGGSARASRAAVLAEGLIYYGLSHTLSLGGLVHGTAAWDAALPGARRRLPDGTSPRGTLYLDSWSVGLGPLVAWRLDTGRALAPLVRLELSASYHRYRRVQLVPAGQSVALAQPSWGRFAVSGRALLGLELRYASHLSVAAGLGLRHTAGASTPWQLDFPFSAGFIW